MSDRDEFEAWVREDGDPILEPYTWGSEDGRYGDVETQIAWEAWQAARRWRPIEEAPKDGTPFVTYTPPERNEDDPIECYDIAHWSDDCGEFIKFGCGFRYVTHWRPLEPPE